MGKEIERKFKIKEMPDLNAYPFKYIEQGYLNTKPVIRVRMEDETFYMTYKGKGHIEREEYNLPLNRESYEHLIKKADGRIICKKRYLIPYEGYTIELDVFEKDLAPLVLAEVEFETLKEANDFIPPEWFAQDVSEDKNYTNAHLALS
ncbi:MAG: CYTH domain-containing protein [Lachnospiraceae bacterium]|nr:CYTH domain-containing protein [Lachnospiraceae bacterium]